MSVAAAGLLGVAVASADGLVVPAPGEHPELEIGHIGGTTILTTARGFTLYWFGPDHPTKSACYGTCAAYWPPLTGTPTAGPRVTGKLGTIRRSDGSLQATFDNHPLYTYVGDSAPGQAAGNDLNLNGGVWYEIRVSVGTR